MRGGGFPLGCGRFCPLGFLSRGGFPPRYPWGGGKNRPWWWLRFNPPAGHASDPVDMSTIARPAIRERSDLSHVASIIPLLPLPVTVSDGLMSSSPSTLSSLPSYNGLSKSRIQSLYSDISRQKHSNPTTYSSNLTWWRSTLEALVSLGYQPNARDTLVLHADQNLLESLRFEGAGKPLCLGTVIVSTLAACRCAMGKRGAD